MNDYVYLVTTTVTPGPELDEFVAGYTRVYRDIDGASAAVAAVITEWFPDGIGSPALRPVGRDQAPSRWGVYEHLTQDLGITDYDLGAEILAGSIDSSPDIGIVSHCADISDGEDMVSYGITRTEVIR